MHRYNYKAWWVERYFSLSVVRGEVAVSEWLTQLESDGRVTDVIKIDETAAGFGLLARIEGPILIEDDGAASGFTEDLRGVVEDTIKRGACP